LLLRGPRCAHRGPVRPVFLKRCPWKRRFPMFPLTLIALTIGAVPTWQTDYDRATWQAKREKKDLVIYFHDQGEFDDMLKDDEVRQRLSRYVCLKLPISYKYKNERLLDHSALEDMRGKPGLVVVSYRDKNLPFYGEVVSAHPYVSSRYGWVPAYGTE